jgi:hypothetical protein
LIAYGMIKRENFFQARRDPMTAMALFMRFNF